MQSISQALEELALNVFAGGILRRRRDSPEGRGFALRDPAAPLSPFLFDFSRANELLARAIVTELYRIVRLSHWCFDAIAGVPRGGNRFAETMTNGPFESRKTLVTLEKGSDGTMKVITPPNFRDQNVLVIEDVVTRGGSTLAAVRALREQDCQIRGVVAIVNREEGGIRALNSNGIGVCALFHMTGLIKLYWERGLIETDEAREMRNYINPFE